MEVDKLCEVSARLLLSKAGLMCIKVSEYEETKTKLFMIFTENGGRIPPVKAKKQLEAALIGTNYNNVEILKQPHVFSFIIS